MSSASGPVLQSSGSCPGCVPVLISFSDKVLCGSVCQINTFPHAALVIVYHSSHEPSKDMDGKWSYMYVSLPDELSVDSAQQWLSSTLYALVSLPGSITQLQTYGNTDDPGYTQLTAQTQTGTQTGYPAFL